MTPSGDISCAATLEVRALSGLPIVSPGNDLAALVGEALARDGITLASGDVLVVASKLVSRAEGRFVDLHGVEPSARALTLSEVTGLEARLVELVLSESLEVSRAAPDVLICRNRLGVVCANAGVDLSNARPSGAPEESGPWAIVLPADPDASAERLRAALAASSGAAIGVVISDSIGRPFRLGSIGAAIGLAGLPALHDQRGFLDLFGRELEHTMTALADQVAGAADLVLGQASEQRGVALVRGLRFPIVEGSARELVRPSSQDLYAAPRARSSGTMSLRSVVALSGGVGGARFAHGLARVLPEGSLTVIVNTGDDFVHWGLAISPDLDTVMYTLAELSDDERGWGLRGETFSALEGVRRYGGEAWFSLGDRDLATHLVRTESLARGEMLSAVTARLTGALGVRARVLPMAEAPCRTMVETENVGILPFQRWFVEHRAPKVRRVWLEGDLSPCAEVIPAIVEADLVVIGPSNPYVSIDPILSLRGVREALSRRPVVAVSPIVRAQAVKGPLAEMIPALSGTPPSAAAVARHYGRLLTGFVVERGDEHDVTDVAVHATDTIMNTREDRASLAREVLSFAATLPGEARGR